MVEGVVTDPREADVGSILGFGFAPYTGGALSFIDGMGLKAFVARAKELAAKYGPRFEPSDKLVADGRARRDVLRNLRREAEGGLSRPRSSAPAEGDLGGGFLGPIRVRRLAWTGGAAPSARRPEWRGRRSRP